MTFNSLDDKFKKNVIDTQNDIKQHLIMIQHKSNY